MEGDLLEQLKEDVELLEVGMQSLFGASTRPARLRLASPLRHAPNACSGSASQPALHRPSSPAGPGR